MERRLTADGIAIVDDLDTYALAAEDAHIITRLFGDDDTALAHAKELLRRCETFEETQRWTDK